MITRDKGGFTQGQTGEKKFSRGQKVARGPKKKSPLQVKPAHGWQGDAKEKKGTAKKGMNAGTD